VSISVCFLRCVVCDCELIALIVMSVLYMDKLSRVYERYKEYVRTNPAAASHLESTVRALSYLIAGETVCQSESKHTLSRLVKQCRARPALDLCSFGYCISFGSCLYCVVIFSIWVLVCLFHKHSNSSNVSRMGFACLVHISKRTNISCSLINMRNKNNAENVL